MRDVGTAPATEQLDMTPSSTVHGGPYDAKRMAFEKILQPVFVAHERWGVCLNQAVHAWYAEMIVSTPTLHAFFGLTWNDPTHVKEAPMYHTVEERAEARVTGSLLVSPSLSGSVSHARVATLLCLN